MLSAPGVTLAFGGSSALGVTLVSDMSPHPPSLVSWRVPVSPRHVSRSSARLLRWCRSGALIGEHTVVTLYRASITEYSQELP